MPGLDRSDFASPPILANRPKEIFDSISTLLYLRELAFGLRLRLANQHTLEIRKRALRCHLNEISLRITRLEINTMNMGCNISERDLLLVIVNHRNKLPFPHHLR